MIENEELNKPSMLVPYIRNYVEKNNRYTQIPKGMCLKCVLMGAHGCIKIISSIRKQLFSNINWFIHHAFMGNSYVTKCKFCLN